MLRRTKINELLKAAQATAHVCVKGWVRTKRASKNVVFIALNDGSTLHNLQVVVDPAQFSVTTLARVTTGASVCIEGALVTSQGQAQSVELQAKKIALLGTAEDYPLQPKRHSLEFLREIAHLRFRTNTFSAVFRVRHAISYAIHQFFHERGFFYLHAPLITGIDAEGAGEVFQVTTLDAKRLPWQEEGREIDFAQDFFGKKTHLTVSGQLAAEAAALGLAEIYTFGPTFRAENSNTTRHLAEFWMVEPEMAFYDLAETMDLAEAFLKYLIQFVLDHCPDDLAFLHQREAKEAATRKANDLGLLLARLEGVLAAPFARITYTDAFAILKASKTNQKGKFAYPIQDWGTDLQSEHERYLVEKYFKKPVIITDYPQDIKAFYMRQNDDQKTVAAMDILFPGIGEMVGGSQREERLQQLSAAMQRCHLDADALKWYLDTRRFGTVPHSGFGLGLERLVQFVTGMENIRDVIPFPRTPGNAAF